MQKSNKFKQWREDAELSQRDVASALGFKTIQMVSNIERGVSTYPMGKIKQVASLFDVQERSVRVEMFLFKEQQLRKKLKL